MANLPLYMLRPVSAADIDGLYDLACSAQGGLSSLQPDRDYLAKYIQMSVDSFASVGGPSDMSITRKYFLGLHHVESGELIGCAAVKTNIGASGEPPFINFDISPDGQFLSASDRFAGATEVGSLYLKREHRAGGLGRYLAKARYLMIAAQPDMFSRTIVAELRGVSHNNKAPFYDAVFAAKFGCSFLEADAQFASLEARALALVSPDKPVRIDSLSAEARRVMGQAHPSGAGALKLLHDEGFCDSHTVDLFDGGPVVAAWRHKITTILESRETLADIGDVDETAPLRLVAAGDLQNFRVAITPAHRKRRYLYLPERAYKELGLRPGDKVQSWRRSAAAAPVQVSESLARV
ncbi:arginine N-succinyltransferase [Robiginitomaculum antarcticum]|uniref:arginine N-succinyltransferase n=1 Tax=Robiginitomaculum antarcticum TaxID=437507 RepID=UPI0003631439|nr:arginine N-succinyltransferase [Robiginitomaculum antarcticum]